MAAKRKFLKLLKYLELDNLASLQTGQLQEVKIKRNSGCWEFYFSFPACLPIKDFLALDRGVKQLFSNLRGVGNVKTFYKYDDCNLCEINVQTYWEEFLNNLCCDSPRLTVLSELSVNFSANQVTYYVANEEEKEIIAPFVSLVNSHLKSTGFNVVATCEISEFETPFSNLVNEQLRLINERVRTEADRERQVSLEGEQQAASPIRRRPRGPREIARTPVALEKIPATETAVIEYNQQYGNLDFVVEGTVIEYEVREVRGGYRIYTATLYDGTDSLLIKTFLNLKNLDAEERFYHNEASTNRRVRAFGNISYDNYARDVVLNIRDIQGLGPAPDKKRSDNAPVKRVELHAHSKMSAQDSIMDIKDYVDMALHFNHTALAITDHYNIHVHPELCQLTKNKDIKPIYGLEGAMVDANNFKIALTDHDIPLKDATFVVYDVETTGLSGRFNEIIEIAGVKIKNNVIIDRFSSYVKPSRLIPPKITEITSITNDDVRNAPNVAEVLPKFYEFIEGTILVAHNATFDNSFLVNNFAKLGIKFNNFPTIDTLVLARVCYNKQMKRFNLTALTRFFDVDLQQHHRAIYDAEATGLVFIKMLRDLFNKKITNYNKINTLIKEDEIHLHEFPYHITILSKNKEGQKALNRIITQSHTITIARNPVIMRSFLEENREHLLIGSSCSNSEVWDAAFNKNYEKLLEVVTHYDYLEVQPPSAYEHIVADSGEDITSRFVKEAIKDIIKAGKEKNIPVVATGDVHHLEKEDVKYRDIFVKSPLLGDGRHALANIEEIPSLYFLTTEEMMAEFSFLDEKTATEIVITNTNLIAERIEKYDIFEPKLFTPRDDFLKDQGVPSFKDAVYNMAFTNATAIYGENLPSYVKARLDKELDSIISNNFASIYYISHLLVKRSNEAGYAVGSRGSVGSSLVATLMSITEVNPLAPHYVCPNCHFSAFKLTPEEESKFTQSPEASVFKEVLATVDTGQDLPDNQCPKCATDLIKEGVDIPFETFLGFDGTKVPDIDLNFSGDYQNRAHDHCREIFGEDNVFRAGTISTVASRIAFGYVSGYHKQHNKQIRLAEINRICKKLEGVKRSSGQHPGGIVVIPDEISYDDIIPVQYPADDTSSKWRTTHYDYHSYEEHLLKLDLLAHDDPTMIRQLMNFVEAYPEEFPFSHFEDIPIFDKDVLKIFSGIEVLGIKPEDCFGEDIGTSGIPEFGTSFTKDMVRDIRPKTFSDLLKVSGLAHGTDVWGGNARDLLLGLKEGVDPIPFKDLIGCRDDIMVYLQSMGIPSKTAFDIMESVRRGRGLTKSQESEMKKHKVPQWYIDSCKKIKYMFPKAHATAYVMMALRIAWFKVHRPIYYYAAYFSRRANAFNVNAMIEGAEAIEAELEKLKPTINSRRAKPREMDLYNSLILSLEMIARGFSFAPVQIKYSHWRDFLVSKNKDSLLIPFSALDSLGAATAQSIYNARRESPFTSKTDVRNRSRINAKLFERLEALNAFGDLPEDDQVGLF